MTHQSRYGTIDIMNQIQQTILTIDDIVEHHTCLEQQHYIDLFLPADRRQEVADDMLMRFTRTFLD